MSTQPTPAPQPGPFWPEHQARAVLALRQLLTPTVLRDMGGESGGKLTRALRGLRRLQSGQAYLAISCHRALATAVREDLRTCQDSGCLQRTRGDLGEPL